MLPESDCLNQMVWINKKFLKTNWFCEWTSRQWPFISWRSLRSQWKFLSISWFLKFSKSSMDNSVDKKVYQFLCNKSLETTSNTMSGTRFACEMFKITLSRPASCPTLRLTKMTWTTRKWHFVVSNKCIIWKYQLISTEKESFLGLSA